MSPTIKRVHEDLGTFVRKHLPAGLAVCRWHWIPPAIQLELREGFSLGPLCRRPVVACIFPFPDLIDVYNSAWLPQLTKLVDDYERYSGNKVEVAVHEPS